MRRPMPERASRRERGATPGRIRRKRVALAAGTGIPVAVLLATLAWRPGPLLVWNASPSSPIGLYRVTAAQGADSGDMVIAWPPGPARVLGAERHYLPRNVPLVKRVAAAAGDRVCARGTAITVNGRPVATRRAADPSGRPLPWWWNGCEVLRGSDLLLLSIAAPQAFDGRYFGISRSDLIVGRARLLWPR
jgi:conjugative transfer signal peptidase TraF